MIDKNKKTIIFDFGNILINLDYKTCFHQFNEVLGYDFSNGMPPKTEAAFHRYEKGEINTESFLWTLQQYNPKAEIRAVIKAWNAILGELPQSRFDMIAQLRPQYNIAMLSNINDLHEKAIHKRVQEDMGIDNFRTLYFDQVFYSHHIGHRKPDPECYAHVTAVLDVHPQDILFIDDMAINIRAAQEAGWSGVVHDPKEDIVNNIDEYLRYLDQGVG